MTATARAPWTDTEQYAVCLAYCIMQQADQNGERVNKSAIRRELRGTDEQPGPLHARSNGSIEAKLMNVSAVAAQRGDVLVKGYKPAPHYQKSLSYYYVMARRIVASDTQQGVRTDLQVATTATV
jgi:hypothetical protein